MSLTWTEIFPLGRAVNLRVNCIGISADGWTHGVGAPYYTGSAWTGWANRFFRSLDNGVTWVSSSANYSSCAWSETGQYGIFGARSGRLFITANYGVTLTQVQPAGDISTTWIAVAMSVTGEVMMAATSSRRIYRSEDSGVTWFEVFPSGIAINRAWKAIAMSQDGLRIMVCSTSSGGFLYLSNDGGVTWTPVADPTV